jgi:hypothetical protein
MAVTRVTAGGIYGSVTRRYRIYDEEEFSDQTGME